MTDTIQIELSGIEKHYGAYHALKNINLSIPKGQFVALVGPSGCGKSTLLRSLAGLEKITGGTMTIAGEVMNDVPPRMRDIAMVFQSYALYPHMTVEQNLTYSLRMRKVPKPEAKRKAEEVAAIAGLSGLLDRYPRQLSGGQRQRVAMGRAIIRNPKAFLFDEPLSNLDAKLRVQMRTEIKRLHQQMPTTTVYVTHDQVEAMTMADRVVVMNKGVIEQAGPPQELYHNPASQFVGGFIGSPSMNMLKAKLEGEGDGLVVVLEDGSRLVVPAARAEAYRPHAGTAVIFGIRPESISSLPPRPGYQALDAKIDLVEPLGPLTMVYFNIGAAALCASIEPESEPKPQTTMTLSFNMNQMHLFDPESGRSLALK